MHRECKRAGHGFPNTIRKAPKALLIGQESGQGTGEALVRPLLEDKFNFNIAEFGGASSSAIPHLETRRFHWLAGSGFATIPSAQTVIFAPDGSGIFVIASSSTR
jgi:hypothetical protein